MTELQLAETSQIRSRTKFEDISVVPLDVTNQTEVVLVRNILLSDIPKGVDRPAFEDHINGLIHSKLIQVVHNQGSPVGYIYCDVDQHDENGVAFYFERIGEEKRGEMTIGGLKLCEQMLTRLNIPSREVREKYRESVSNDLLNKVKADLQRSPFHAYTIPTNEESIRLQKSIGFVPMTTAVDGQLGFQLDLDAFDEAWKVQEAYQNATPLPVDIET